MSFKGIRNTNGRPKGSLNKLNSEVKETIANIIEGNAEGFKERLERLNDSDFIKHYLQLLKFVILSFWYFIKLFAITKRCITTRFSN